MGVLDQLAGALGRRDEGPNVALAEQLAASGDKDAIVELAEAVRSGTPRQRNDAMKVLYEIGARRPNLVIPHCGLFLEALASSNDRQVGGAMEALDSIASQRANEIAAELPRIIEAADKGSVTAKDRCTSILVKLARAGYADRAMPALIEQVKKAAPAQLPHYAEQAASVLPPAEKPGFLAMLKDRVGQLGQRGKRERLEKLMDKLNG